MDEQKTGIDLFKHIFELSQQTITITSLHEGIFMDINPAFEKATGYSREEIIGKTAADIQIWVDSDFRKKIVELLARDGKVSKKESLFRRKDGTIGHTTISAEIIDYKGISCIIAIFEDLSQQKAKEYEYLQTIDNLPLGVFKSTADGRILSANIAMCRIYGFDSVSEILNCPAIEFYSEEKDRDHMLRELESKGILLNYQTLVKKRDGSKIWTSTNYKAIYNKFNKLEFIEGIVEDITPRKQIEEALFQNRELMLSFINSHPDIMFLKDEQFKYIIVNNQLEDYFGKTSEQIQNCTDYDLLDQQAADNCRQSDSKAIEANKLIVNEESMQDRIYETIKFPVKLGNNRTGVVVLSATLLNEKKWRIRSKKAKNGFANYSRTTVLLFY